MSAIRPRDGTLVKEDPVAVHAKNLRYAPSPTGTLMADRRNYLRLVPELVVGVLLTVVVAAAALVLTLLGD
jgi:hypothetical protein